MKNIRLVIFDWEGTLMQPDRRLYPGVEKTLYLLNPHYLLAIASNRARLSMQKLLSELALTHFFSSIRCADETFFKPHPLMLQEILDELDIEITEAVMIGDSKDDMRMAQKIGMPRIAACYRGVTPAMQSCQPDFSVSCIEELQALLLPSM